MLKPGSTNQDKGFSKSKVFKKIVEFYRRRDSRMQQYHKDKIDMKHGTYNEMQHAFSNIKNYLPGSKKASSTQNDETTLHKNKEEDQKKLYEILRGFHLQQDISPEAKKAIQVEKSLDDLFGDNDEPNGDFLYNENIAGDLFPYIAFSDDYKSLSQEEIIHYFNNKDVFKPLFEDKDIKNIIIYGCGDGQKDMQVLESIDPSLSILNNKNVIPIDQNPSYVKSAGEYIKNTCKKKGVSTKEGGFVDNFIHAYALGNARLEGKLYVFLGGSIGNLSDSDIATTIENIKSDRVNGSRKCIMTVFFAPMKAQKHTNKYGEIETHINTNYEAQVDSLIEHYKDPAIENWVMKGFKELGIDPSCLEFHVTYQENKNDNGGKVLVGAKVIKPITVSHLGKTYTKDAGDTLRAIQSKRFDPETFASIVQKAGGTLSIPEFNTTLSGGPTPVIIETKKSNPEAKSEEQRTKESKIKRVTYYTSVALLAAFGIIKGTSMIKDEQYKKKQEKVQNSITSKSLEGKDISYNGISYNDVMKNDYFENVKEKYFTLLYNRYNLQKLSEGEQSIIKDHLHQRLLNQDESVMSVAVAHGPHDMNREKYQNNISELLEKFVQQTEYILMKDYDIQLVYHSELQGHEEAMKNTLEQNKTISCKQFSLLSSSASSMAGAKYRREGYTWLGTYTTKRGEKYVIGEHTYLGKKVIVGCPVGLYDKTATKEYIYDTQDGDKVVNSMLTTEYGKIVARDYYERPYCYQVANKVSEYCKKEGIVVEEANIVNYMSSHIQDGYDFSRIASTSNHDVVSYFIPTYLNFICRGMKDEKLRADIEKKNLIEQIVNIYQQAPQALPGLNIESEKDGQIKSDIFKYLCHYPLTDTSKKGVSKWIREHISIFSPYMMKNTPYITPAKQAILSGSKPYIKQNPLDIKRGPGLLGTEIYLYKGYDGLTYEVLKKDNIIYARLCTNIESPEKVRKTVNQLAESIIKECKKSPGSPRGTDIQKREKMGTIDPFQLETARNTVKQNLINQLYGFNAEMGNWVLHDITGPDMLGPPM